MSNEPTHDGRLAEQLRRLLQALELSGRSVLPSTNLPLLQSIVDAAARIFGAAAASIALVDEQREHLEFKVSHGAGQDEIIGMRIPIDKGIAGYVAMTGQPLAISDVQRDARFNQSFAASTGYVPRSILATPLLSGDRVLGVMEVLDKMAAPSFSIQDMELLGMFAHQAALAIDQSQQYEQINAALVRGLRELVSQGETLASQGETPVDEIAAALAGDDAQPGAQDLLALAKLYNDISHLGEAERRACLRVLETFGDYARSRPDRFM